MVYFSDLVRVFRRRWAIFLCGLLTLGGAVGGIMYFVPTGYQASGNVLFLLPAKTADGKVNPFVNLQGGLIVAATIVGGVLSTQDTQRAMASAGYTSDYSVAQVPGSGAPLLVVQAQDTNPTMAVATVNEVIRRIELQLKKMQDDAGAPADQYISATAYSVTPQAEVQHGAKLRALAVAVAVVGVLTLMVAFGVDGRSRRAGAAALESLPEGGRRMSKGRRAGRWRRRKRTRVDFGAGVDPIQVDSEADAPPVDPSEARPVRDDRADSLPLPNDEGLPELSDGHTPDGESEFAPMFPRR